MRGRWAGWTVTIAVVILALLTVDPASLGLSTYEPFAQVIAMRGLLSLVLLMAAFAAGLCAVLVLHRGEARPVRLGITFLVLLAVGVVHAGVVVARGPSAAAALPEGKPDGAVDVLAFNALHQGASIEDVVRALDEHRPDVAVLPEVAESRAETIIKNAAGDFALFMGRGRYGRSVPTALLIAHTLGEYERIDGPDTALGTVGAEPANGDGPVLYGVHTMSPVGERMPTWRADLELVTGLCSGTDGIIMAGDFNATFDHAPMRETTCVDGSVGDGGVGTWPTGFPRVLGASIDHVLVDPDRWQPSGSAVFEVPGSDHRGVVVRLRPKQ
ncbi:endonuclease/exonuclease/phosphatase family protein [Blastococcus sp. Marseille-P5729]|uniref:endonuclease/exonuclease/phosphatase family protein n=1 Tax=Blastococcus sp. Marseille-P5729 TaxID=2086582 RepID=UPI00131CDFB0|nr:endonuclease/exonuclease/phosphatase family protein [Blastococcus sp. Marseille-P5729]